VEFKESVLWSLDRTKSTLNRSLEGLTNEQAAFRPCDNCNSIGSMVIHLGRVQDTWTTRIVGGADIWETDGWAEKLGLPAADRGWSYDKQSMEEKRPLSDLAAYYEAALGRHSSAIRDLPTSRLGDKAESPLNLSIEQTLLFIIVELGQHIGQIDYLKGMQTPNG
jgi:hypothetical protein